MFSHYSYAIQYYHEFIWSHGYQFFVVGGNILLKVDM